MLRHFIKLHWGPELNFGNDSIKALSWEYFWPTKKKTQHHKYSKSVGQLCVCEILHSLVLHYLLFQELVQCHLRDFHCSLSPMCTLLYSIIKFFIHFVHKGIGRQRSEQISATCRNTKSQTSREKHRLEGSPGDGHAEGDAVWGGGNSGEAVCSKHEWHFKDKCSRH